MVNPISPRRVDSSTLAGSTCYSWLAAASIGPVGDLHIVNKKLSPDGVERSTVLAGGTFPGPVIRANKGDNLQIRVFNDLTDTSMDVVTSVHWHGISQHNTNWADGVTSVTQCPIIPGESFLYNFTASDQAGTYWYHSHYSTQYCDGLRGPLIVYDPEDPHKGLYDVDDESTILTLTDWYHYLSTDPNRPPISQPSSTLINGLGRYSNGSTSTDGPLAVVNVVHGKRYRYRLISISCDANFIFSIDGHSMTIIEVDGGNVKPLRVDSIQILAAQRYSFILEANQPVGNYWMRAISNRNYSNDSIPGVDSAILRYKGAPNKEPTSKSKKSVIPLVESNLHPLVPTPVPGVLAPGGADQTIKLDVTFANSSFLMNGVTWNPTDMPLLLQILNGKNRAQDLLPKGSVYGLKLNQTVDVIIPGGVVGGPHPIHLHGHSFFVLRSSGNGTYNFVDPVVRDTVAMGNTPGDDIVIRFVTDNAGPWFLHCHIDWHLSAGFAVVMAEEVDAVASLESVPPAWNDLCPHYMDFTSHS
ncbi:laccase [Dentipellis sp. KUC8613]|nr:laccase [Dentipellis sp. KUC8613]